MKKVLLVLLMLMSLNAVSACNTMEGFGEDVQKAGDSIEDAAQKHK